MRKEQKNKNLIFPLYPCKAIWTLQDLAQTLGINHQLLLDTAENMDNLYIPKKPERKSDGTFRYKFDAKTPLKDIQNSIKNKILRKVLWPPYLQGSIRDKENPRSYVKNAQIHTGSRIICKLDISKFFPSITEKIVFDIWEKFFGFSKEMSQLLTKLTTKNGFIPEGIKTSSYLGSLVFFDNEPLLYKDLKIENLNYSRYVDDIVVSSVKKIDNKLKSNIISKVKGMFLSKGLRLNKRKLSILSSKESMTVNNLVINSNKASIPKKKRDKIRAAVHDCKQCAAKDKRKGVPYQKLFTNVKGRVSRLKQLHPRLGKKYLEELSKISPLD